MANRSNFYRLEMLLLSILREQDCYGYQLTKAIKDKSNGLINVGEGTMYNILYKLLDDKMITSYETVVNRKIRVYYHIEDAGRAYFEELVEEFHTMVSMVEDIIQERR